jgi:hypothetical protein
MQEEVLPAAGNINLKLEGFGRERNLVQIEFKIEQMNESSTKQIESVSE